MCISGLKVGHATVLLLKTRSFSSSYKAATLITDSEIRKKTEVG
jgi:hypothetical protein